MTDKLLSCWFCGNTPGENSHYTDQGTKWGGILCCIKGPEVRTSYQDWPAWKDEAIKAWNTRVQPEWPDISTAPDEGTFLVLMPEENKALGTDIALMMKHPNVSFINGLFAHDFPKPTHWMLIPTPPEKDE